MKFLKEFRCNETGTLFYRLFLAYVFYQAARFLFWLFNRHKIPVEDIKTYLKLAYHGIAFDTTAILYTNFLFIFLSLVPVFINTHPKYQKSLFWLYFITNGTAYAANFIDFVYYPFEQMRLTSAVFEVIKHEHNFFKIFIAASTEHPFVAVWYLVLMTLWWILYRKIKVKLHKPKNRLVYFSASVFLLGMVSVLAVGGIRGDFKHSTRPINMVDAGKYVAQLEQANIVLNSTFSFLRTINTNHFKEVRFMDDQSVLSLVHPYKLYPRKTSLKPNIVLIIVESFGREYSGAFNKNTGIKNYKSFTPFIDSLAQHSLIFTNAFANGRQSIHAMSSILAGIPNLTDAFTSSPYANQKIQSLVSICNEMGYNTSFYHGAPNGSMGFQGFSKILGFKHYFGKNEYNNDDDFDGIWAIWDEPFLQYFAKNVGHKTPFFATVFTASSHHPFKVPERYESKFKKGYINMHKPIRYTDYALKRYFKTVSELDWYQNTIFVITADHTNQSYYPFYTRGLNNFAVPVLFFSPNAAYQLKGENHSPAQQTDIYPSLVDLIGYNKPFRSWGRSLVSNKKEDYTIVCSNGVTCFFFSGNYIYNFDEKNIIGIYDKNDIGLEKNIIQSINTPQINAGKQTLLAWYQDYMNRIIRRKLN